MGCLCRQGRDDRSLAIRGRRFPIAKFVGTDVWDLSPSRGSVGSQDRVPQPFPRSAITYGLFGQGDGALNSLLAMRGGFRPCLREEWLDTTGATGSEGHTRPVG